MTTFEILLAVMTFISGGGSVIIGFVSNRKNREIDISIMGMEKRFDTEMEKFKNDLDHRMSMLESQNDAKMQSLISQFNVLAKNLVDVGSVFTADMRMIQSEISEMKKDVAEALVYRQMFDFFRTEMKDMRRALDNIPYKRRDDHEE